MIDRDLIGREQIYLINDSFQNRKQYNIPKAQLVLTDIPYNLSNNAYASNPQWYVDGDNTKGESKLANSQFFDTDKNFNLHEFFHFCSKLLKPEPKEVNNAGCLIIFCAFQQQFELIEMAKKFGFNNIEKNNTWYKDKDAVNKKLKELGIQTFATGGYTGGWGPEGKLAILHEKELILN